MTRKPDPAPVAPPAAVPAHPLPTEGGCFILVDGALQVDPAHAPPPTNPDTEV